MTFSSVLGSIARVGVRTRLSLLVFLAILPLLGLLVAGASVDRILAQAGAGTRAVDLARLGAEREVDLFKEARGLLDTLYGLTQTRALDWRACDRVMAAVATRNARFLSLGVVAADGRVSCHSRAGHPPRFADSDILARAIASAPATMLIGKIRFNPVVGRRTVMMAMPFYQTASPDLPRTGIVFVGLDPQWLEHAASDISDNGSHSVLMIDARDGRLLVTVPPRRPQDGSIAPAPLNRALRSGAPYGVVEIDEPPAPPRIFGFARLRAFDDVVVAVGLSRDAALAESNGRFTIGIALSIVATFVAIGAAWLLADFAQLRPIKELAGIAKRLGAGDLEARARVAPWQAPEFRALADTFATMATRIALARASQSQSEQQLRLLADNVTDMIVRIDRSGRRLYVSPSCRTLLGYEPEEMLAVKARDAIHPDDLEALAAILAPGDFGSETVTCRYRLRRKDDRWQWVEGASRAVPVEPGREPENIVVVRDIDRQVAAERQLKESEARYRILAEHSTDMVFQLDRSMVRRYVSPACRELVGREPEEMVGVKPVSMAHPDDAVMLEDTFRRLFSGELPRASLVSRIRHRDGHWVWVEAEMRAVFDPTTGAATGIIGAVRDISGRKKAEDRLEAANRQLALLATRDSLTGLVNRRGFDEALETEFRRALRENAHLGLILVDVDRFKAFNDLYGHQAGDECLRVIARAVESAVRRSHDVAARYGGEELAVLLPHADAGASMHMAERVRLAIRNLAISHTGSDSGIVTISAGVASVSPRAVPVDATELVRATDLALYEAKGKGRDRVCAAQVRDVASRALAAGAAK